LESPLGLFPDKGPASAVIEPDTTKVDKQTVTGTVFPPVQDDPNKGPDMAGCIGSTKSGRAEKATPVDAPAKDPTPTDHVTGAMGNSPSNPEVLPKTGPAGGGSVMMQPMDQPQGQNISIDIAESKKLLKKMIKENTKGAATAFGSKQEGYGGDPSTDPAYAPGKRWTVDYGRKTQKMKEDSYGDVGDHNDEIVRQAVKTVVSQTSYNEEEDIGSILAYLGDQGINVSDDVVDRMYREEMAKRTIPRDYRKNPAPETWGKANTA
jgi:hypothetical protein